MALIPGLSETDSTIYRSALYFCSARINCYVGDNIDAYIQEIISSAIELFKSYVLDEDSLRSYLNFEISQERNLENSHVITAEDVRNSIWWTEYNKTAVTHFFNRYHKYLSDFKGWDHGSISRSIDNTGNDIMNFLVDPRCGKIAERRGIVVGYVQSGKTAQYIGLINKAIDAGYKIIIVLTGIHNSLRSQGQQRIDEEVLGYETSTEALAKQAEMAQNNIIGVGRIAPTPFNIQTLTSRDEKGDFAKSRKSIHISLDIPTIIVTKKTSSILDNIIANFSENTACQVQQDGSKLMPAKYPLLLIDDEADQASINTNYRYDDNGDLINDDETNPTTINRKIRLILSLFSCRSYIGYTATPYANIFIPDQIRNPMYGSDLFPKDFIYCLPKPPNYIGANEFFGCADYVAMPLRRKINDITTSITKELPEDLKEAILSFIIAIAIRNCRGNLTKPNSMLIHVSRLQASQETIKRKVETYYNTLSSMIVNRDVNLWGRIGKLYDADFSLTTREMETRFPQYIYSFPNVTKTHVYSEIHRLAKNGLIKIKSINGSSKDSLCYKENESKEYNVICIGGDKLSRGLTLEGLSISYFTRESKMYDTLMQMGRWFGFRPGYADLCRVYTTNTLNNWFNRIASATEELRDQIIYMCELNTTPEKFGLHIQVHPNMMISSPKKVKTGETVSLNFSNVLTQTRSIDVDLQQYERNFNAVETLLKQIGPCCSAKEHCKQLGREDMKGMDHYFWHNVPGTFIANFMEQYHTSQNASKVNSHNIAQYIKDQIVNEQGLTSWSVCLINAKSNSNCYSIAGLNVNGIVRGKRNDATTDSDGNGSFTIDDDRQTCSIKAFTSSGHEFMDYTQQQMNSQEQLKAQYIKDGRGSKCPADYLRGLIRDDRRKAFLILYPIDFLNEDYDTCQMKIGNGNHKPPIGFAAVFPPNQGKGSLVSYIPNAIAKRNDENEFFE